MFSGKYLLVMQCFWVVYYGISHKRLVHIWTVAKKDCLPPDIFIEAVTIFHKRPGTKFSSPIFYKGLNGRLPRFAFTRWQTWYTEREHAKQVLITRFYLDYLTCYNGTNARGGHEFNRNFSFSRYRRFNMIVRA